MGGFAGVALFGSSLHALRDTGPRATGIRLDRSDPGTPSASFVRSCQRVLAEAGDLGRSLAQLATDRAVRLYRVAEADSWLSDNGYRASLEVFRAHGGSRIVLFQELNVFGEAQFSTDPRTLAYLAHVLRNEGFSVLFPGPAASAISTGTWLTGVREYFVRYDLLGPGHEPRTLGQVYPRNVDSAVADRTLLWHSGRGLFEGLAWHYGGDTRLTDVARSLVARRSQIAWVRQNVDASLPVYLVQAGRAVGAQPENSVGLVAARGKQRSRRVQCAGPFPT